MITVHAQPSLTIEGVSRHECEALASVDPIRQAEIISIQRFLAVRRELFVGRVLDFGAGKPGTCRRPQPYRQMIEQPGVEYLPYDRGDVLRNPPFDVVVCTQVLQYVDDPPLVIRQFAEWLRPRQGVLLLTYATNWAECEQDDLWRFTQAGMERMLLRAGFAIGVHERRAELQVGTYTFPLGYGVVAVAR